MRAKPINYDLLKRLYEIYNSAYGIAKRLGCSIEHVRRELLRQGIRDASTMYSRGRQAQLLSKDRLDEAFLRFTSIPPKAHNGIVANWLRDHPGVKLPRNAEEIAKIIGTEATTVRNYFYRRRQERKRQLEKLPDLKRMEVWLSTMEGKNTSSKDWLSYSYWIEYYDLSIIIEVVEADGKEHLCEVPDSNKFFRQLQGLVLAMTVEDRRKVFEEGDKIQAVFRNSSSHGRKAKPKAVDFVSPTAAEIDRIVNGDHLLEQPSDSEDL